MKRNLKQACLLLALILTVLSFPANAVNTNFKDVPVGIWYAEPVTWAVEHEITNGTSSTAFSPNQTCSKAQVLTFLWRAAGMPDTTTKNPFSDVASGSYYYKAALWAHDMGMVSNGRFNPTQPCTRSMAVTYLWNMAGSPSVYVDDRFSDVKKSDNYAQAVIWAVGMEITNGMGNNRFSPSETCTRAQVMTFLYRAKSFVDPLDGNNVSFDDNEDSQPNGGPTVTPCPNTPLQGASNSSDDGMIDIIFSN